MGLVEKLAAVGLVSGLALVVVAGGLALDFGSAEDEVAGRPRELTLFAEDSSRAARHGLVQGVPRVGLAGRHDTAYSFDRAGASVQVPAGRALNPQARDFLISAWVRLVHSPGGSTPYDVVTKGGRRTAGFSMHVLEDGSVRCRAMDVEGHLVRVIMGRFPVTDGRWHRIGCARTGPAWSVLVDDTVRWKTASFTRISGPTALVIGSAHGPDDHADGRVDSVQLFMGRNPASEQYTDEVVADAVDALRTGRVVGDWGLDERAPTH